MKKVVGYAMVMLFTYALAWTGSYACVFIALGDGLNFAYFFEYLVLAWTFNGFELPSLNWFLSIVSFLPLSVLAVFLIRTYERQSASQRKGAAI